MSELDSGVLVINIVSNFRFRKATLFVALASLTVAAHANNAGAPATVDDPDEEISDVQNKAQMATVSAMATPTLITARVATPKGDSNFKALFGAMNTMSNTASRTIAIPSRKPVDSMRLTSSFGMRNHPVLRKRMRHNGIDIPAATGTPIYAPADGVVGRAQRLGGYGNYAEIEHGNGIQTRFGHMSRIAVSPGQRVSRGQIVGYVGSTGRSTGPHLHYEVRIAGTPVNPIPFVETHTNYAYVGDGKTQMGGPE